jgi:CDR ABC transporter
MFSSMSTLQSPSVDVNVYTERNIYQYSRWQLWTAYGIGAAFTLFGVIIGLWCLHVNEAAYSNSFSTMIRVTRDSHFAELILDKDTSGVDPSPSYLQKVKVQLMQITSEKDSEGHRYAIRSSHNVDAM